MPQEWSTCVHGHPSQGGRVDIPDRDRGPVRGVGGDLEEQPGQLLNEEASLLSGDCHDAVTAHFTDNPVAAELSDFLGTENLQTELRGSTRDRFDDPG